MTDADWHAPPTLLARFAARPRRVDDMTAASLEAHLVACADCRRQLTAAVDPALAAASWDAVADRIDRPRPALLERLLHRIGIGSDLRPAARRHAGPPGRGPPRHRRRRRRRRRAVAHAGRRGPVPRARPPRPAGGRGGLVRPGGRSRRRGRRRHAAARRRAGRAAGDRHPRRHLRRARPRRRSALPDLGPRRRGLGAAGPRPRPGALALGTWLRVEVAVGVLAGSLAARGVVACGGSTAATSPSPTPPPSPSPASWPRSSPPRRRPSSLVTRRDRFATLEAFR